MQDLPAGLSSEASGDSSEDRIQELTRQLAEAQAELARRTSEVIVVGATALACSPIVKEFWDMQQAALADARRDAERYRFLRESGNTGKNGDTLQRGITIANKFGAILHFVYWTDKAGFDAAIDAAMSGGTGE